MPSPAARLIAALALLCACDARPQEHTVLESSGGYRFMAISEASREASRDDLREWRLRGTASTTLGSPETDKTTLHIMQGHPIWPRGTVAVSASVESPTMIRLEFKRP